MFRVILSTLLFAIFSFMPATASFADIEAEAEFARRHLDVQPASGWKKEAIGSGMFSECMLYVNKAENLALMACPFPDTKEFKEYLKEVSKYDNVQAAGKGYLSRRYDGKWDDLSVPLKNGGGGAFFLIGEADDNDVDHDKYWVTLDKNGVQFTGLDLKLAQRAEPMLRAFNDFDIPAKFPSLSPAILFDQEELFEQYSARRAWKLALPPGWIEQAPFSRQDCFEQEGQPQAYAKYIMPEKLAVSIKICSSPKSAREIIRAFYDGEKQAEKEYPQNGRFCKEPVEKNGSWKMERATPQSNKILWISSANGHYSEISIDAVKDASFKPAWELLGTLRTDNPELFPQSYE